MNSHRYSPSTNPYAERISDVADWVLANQDTEKHAGNWQNQFLASKLVLKTEAPPSQSSPQPPLHLEIGCNAGHVLVEWAKARPNERFIGLDWKYKQIFRAGQKAKNAKLENILFFRGLTERVPLQFGPSELSSVNIFFPDPWVKNKQKKHRPFLAAWFKQVARLLMPGGFVHLKTDHSDYFDFVIKEMMASGAFEIMSLTRNLHENHPNPLALKVPDVTLFERLFIAEGIPIKQFIARKIAET